MLSTEWVAEHVFDAEESKIIEVFKYLPPGLLILMTVVVAPLVEEFIYRGWMRLKDWTIPFFTSGSIVMILLNFSQELGVGLGILVFILSWLFLPKLKHNMDINFQWWFYGSAVLFGITHLGNYELSFWALLFTLPQITLGIAIGFFRVQKGFMMGVLVHALWNGMLMAAMLHPYFDGSMRHAEGEHYTLDWKPGSLWKRGHSVYISSDEIKFDNVRLEEVIQRLLKQEEPDAIIEVDGFSIAKLNAVLTGDLQAATADAFTQWKEEFGITVDTLIHEETVTYLYADTSCTTTKVPGETMSTLKVLKRSYEFASLDFLATQFQDVYEQRFKLDTAALNDQSYSFFMPIEGADSALHALAYYNCIQHVEKKENVTRYIIHIPEL